MSRRCLLLGVGVWFIAGLHGWLATGAAQPPDKPWLYAKARALPKHLTNQGSGYFALVEGKDGRIYVGTALYGQNAYLVEFDPETDQMRVVVDCMREIGSTATGFAAQAKIHTRMNVGPSGKIYFGTKQGYPDAKLGEKFTDYPGGYPMVYDPASGTTKVYPIPVPHQGIISMTPDEARNVAYISTCSDERPRESCHFLQLDLATGKYRDFGETNHMYAFIVVDRWGRAYHPQLGGDLLRFDPKTDRLERLKQTIDGEPPTLESHLADEHSHPINWEIDGNRTTLYAVPMSGNQLYAYDLSAVGETLPGRSLGKLVASAESTDCRALCISPTGVVWAAVRARYNPRRRFAQLISYKPGDAAPTDQGPLAIENPDFSVFEDRKGEPLPWHQGFPRFGDGNMIPGTGLLGVCATRRAQYVLALAPLTLLETHAPLRPQGRISRKPVAGITTVYYLNSHSDVLLGRMVQTETLDGRGRIPALELAALYVDQKLQRDTSHVLMPQMGIPVVDRVGDALTRGGNQIAVEGLMVVAEHGEYPKSSIGAIEYPKRKFFEQVFAVLDQHGRRGMPVFCDKHLSNTWTDAKWIYDEAKRREMPLLAGSSLPVAWRIPPIDLPRETRLREIHILNFGNEEVYGIHALEAMQALAERRAGGETGVAAVQTLSGNEVWTAAERGLYDRRLLDAAFSAMWERPLPPGRRVEEMVKQPLLSIIEYRDGLKACMFTLNGAVAEWTTAWKDDRDQISSLAFVTQDARPSSHFAVLFNAIEQMMYSGRAPWPVERTLLTSGVLEACLQSLASGGKRLETPHLDVQYQSAWNWTLPIGPAPPRPYKSQ